MTITLKYFASLREAKGVSEETRETGATSPAELLEELALPIAREHLRVAVNDTFASWEQPLQDGDTVTFVPPVAGG